MRGSASTRTSIETNRLTKVTPTMKRATAGLILLAPLAALVWVVVRHRHAGPATTADQDQPDRPAGAGPGLTAITPRDAGRGADPRLGAGRPRAP